MTPAVRIRAEAAADIQEAYEWYEARVLGLGGDLLEEIESCLERIMENRLAYAVVHKFVRRALLRRFPYGLFYLIEGDEIILIACFHSSRNPKIWRQRT